MMAAIMSLWPTCKMPTPHRSTGVSSKVTEPDGRVYQQMECTICRTSTKVYFTKGTNESQENLDAPNVSEG